MERDLKQRIIEISKQEQLSHLGSCLSAVDAIDAIYSVKADDERFVLSNGHAALALYTVMEKHNKANAEKLIKDIGVHPQKTEGLIDVSTGSLGQGFPIAVGMAMANRYKNVYCMVSDGEMAEGSIWESLRIAGEQQLFNLKVVLNANGWAAYRKTDIDYFKNQVKSFDWRVFTVNGHNKNQLINALLDGEEPDYLKECLQPTFIIAKTKVEHHPELSGLSAHYKVLK
jgi:transketolase